MQKALIEMNIRLPEVLNQVHGKSGMALIEAILSGERDRTTLLALCHESIQKNKKEEVLKALEGHYTEAGLFSLRQSYHAYHFYKKQINECKKIALGAFGRRIKSRKGPAIAVKATARKLAAQYWRLMVKGAAYVEQGVEF